MNKEQIESLKNHLVRYTNHLAKTERDKRETNAACNEEIKAAKYKCVAIAESIKEGDISILTNAFDSEMVDTLLKGANNGNES